MRDDTVKHLTEVGYLVLHDMFSRILKFLFVTVFDRDARRSGPTIPFLGIRFSPKLAINPWKLDL